MGSNPAGRARQTKKGPRGPFFNPVTLGQAAFTRLAISTVSFRSCLSKARSDGVSILDTKEIPGFAFREGRKIVAAGFGPPSFEFGSMFVPQSFT